jgi:hypothetical protein
MKSRSGAEICLPAVLIALALLVSLPTRILAVLWLFAGAVCVGHRELNTFPNEGVPLKWRTGTRAWLLWLYHFIWWPWYMRSEIAHIASNARTYLSRLKRRGKSDGSDESDTDSRRGDDG